MPPPKKSNRMLALEKLQKRPPKCPGGRCDVRAALVRSDPKVRQIIGCGNKMTGSLNFIVG